MNLLKLRGMRITKGYTQEKLAKMIGISAKTYNRKELGVIDFNLQEITTIVDLFGLNLDEVNEIFFDNKITNRISNCQAINSYASLE
ncbi:MAG: hypothetical protein PWQ59_2071 [Thermoanaerobacterium sp.]|nr:hypothetical protein [Thermoanaerobacterium sp.]MDI3530132.1 hypothetical protein [Thermoanaerobacter sp.]